jgi:hypothetical protein
VFLFPKSKELQNFVLFATLRQTETSNASETEGVVNVSKIDRFWKFVENLEDPSFGYLWGLPGNASFGYKFKNCRMEVPRGLSYLKKSKKVLYFRKISSVAIEKHEKKYKGVKYREKASQDTDDIIPKFFSTDGSLTLTIYLRQTCVFIRRFTLVTVQFSKGKACLKRNLQRP